VDSYLQGQMTVESTSYMVDLYLTHILTADRKLSLAISQQMAFICIN